MILLTGRMLTRLGYNVLSTQSPKEAIILATEHSEEIDLLTTCLAMLEMSGLQLVEKIISMNSKIKIIFMSGYTQDIIATHGVIDKDICFIQKPFTMKLLDDQLKEVLSSNTSDS